MNKFWATILRIIIVISFVGVIIFLGLFIFNNLYTSYEAYNYIVATSHSTEFSKLRSNVYAHVKDTYNGSSDPYANFINSAIEELNEGIEYFVDYLSLEGEVSKGEQDKLRAYYKDYISGFNETVSAYDTYIEAYNYAKIQYENSTEQADYALANLKAKEVFLIKTYADCYKLGSKFFKNLIKVVKAYTLGGKGDFAYKGQKYMIKNGFVDYSLEFVSSNMNKKNDDLAYETNVRSNREVDNYYNFLEHENRFSDKDVISNTGFKNFVNNLNQLDVFEWAGNYEDYYGGLGEDKQPLALSALQFFNNNFKG